MSYKRLTPCIFIDKGKAVTWFDDRSVLSGRSADLKKRLFRKTEDSRYRPVPASARLRAGAGGISEAV